jgi:heme-degrading monooxygenase HmoA
MPYQTRPGGMWIPRSGPRPPLVDSHAVTILSYLRFTLRPEADRDDFERDMRAMLELARGQPGYQWADMGPSMLDPAIYLVVSEWDDVELVRAWEHVEEHAGIMQKWEPVYGDPLLHRRFVPWQRPSPQPEAAPEQLS